MALSWVSVVDLPGVVLTGVNTPLSSGSMYTTDGSNFVVIGATHIITTDPPGGGSICTQAFPITGPYAYDPYIGVILPEEFTYTGRHRLVILSNTIEKIPGRRP